MRIRHSSLLTFIAAASIFPLTAVADIPPQVYFDPVEQEDYHCFMITEEGDVINLESRCYNKPTNSPDASTLSRQLIGLYQARFCDPRPVNKINPNNLTPVYDQASREVFMRREAFYAVMQRSHRHFPGQEEERKDFLRNNVEPYYIESLDDCPT